jgi:aminomethyltransferase
VTTSNALLQTPLYALHRQLGARMVPFAGYEMPVQYPTGLMAEHRQCRTAAALFDVSHMGQIQLTGDSSALALESLVPMDVAGLAAGRQRYAFFTSPDGGILDDLMIVRPPPGSAFADWLLVVNAGCKDADLAHLQQHIGTRCHVQALPDRALLALQGPAATTALARLHAGVSEMSFMAAATFSLAGADCLVTRSGYTGEDGYEISVPGAQAEALARELLMQPEVLPAGLGARDTLRLEAGLCLHGQDIDATTTPIEAGLQWAIQKVRRPGGARAGGYLGAATLEAQMAQGPSRRRVGLLGLERVPVRPGTALVDAAGQPLGTVCSGTLSPTLDQPVAMAYLPSSSAETGTVLYADVRGRRVPMRVSSMPFTPHRYHR